MISILAFPFFIVNSNVWFFFLHIPELSSFLDNYPKFSLYFQLIDNLNSYNFSTYRNALITGNILSLIHYKESN